MKTTAPEETKTGIMVALGYTEKEIANKMGKSIHTIKQQKRRLFKKTNSHNLADLTRYLINRYCGIQTEDILLHIMHDLTLVAFVVFLAVMAVNTGAGDWLKTAFTYLQELFFNY